MGLITRALVICALTTAVALSPAAGRAEETPRSTASSSRTATKVQIDNFGQVNVNYYRGAQPVGHDYADLKTLGVKTVIDLQADGSPAEKGLVEAAGMRFHRIGMTTREAPTSEQLASFLTLVNDPANQPVYVHCAGGRHRTGVMTAVYRMTREGWAADRAFKEMKQYKFGADLLHPEFKRFVYAYKVEPAAPGGAIIATNVLVNAPLPAAAR